MPILPHICSLEEQCNIANPLQIPLWCSPQAVPPTRGGHNDINVLSFEAHKSMLMPNDLVHIPVFCPVQLKDSDGMLAYMRAAGVEDCPVSMHKRLILWSRLQLMRLRPAAPLSSASIASMLSLPEPSSDPRPSPTHFQTFPPPLPPFLNVRSARRVGYKCRVYDCLSDSGCEVQAQAR